jgi:hypothetical protein
MKNSEKKELRFHDKIHQLCSIEFEKSKKSYGYVIPILQQLVNFGRSDSRTLLANILNYENKIGKIDIIQMYKLSVEDGEPCAMYNLYLMYTEMDDEVNAYRYFSMARENGFPFALEEDFKSEFERYRGINK